MAASLRDVRNASDTNGAGGSPAGFAAATGRRSPYNTMSRAGAEVAGTPPLTPTLGSGREAHGSDIGREPQPQTGRFSALRTMLRRMGRRERPSQNQPDAQDAGGDAGSSPQPQQRSSGFPWGGRHSRSHRAEAQGLFAQLQFAREARDLEVALHRSLEENGERGPARPLPPRGASPAALAGASRASASSREAAESHSLRGAPAGPPRAGWSRDASRFSGAWESVPDGAVDDDEDTLVARILAHGLRERAIEVDGRVERRHEPSSSASSVAAAPPRPSSSLSGSGLGMSLGSGEMMAPRAARHAALAAYSGGFGRRGYQYGLQAAGLDDAGLQEVIEASKRAHLLAELPRERYHQERHKSLVECELCLMEYEVGDELLRLPCMHLFHAACVAPWLQKMYTCPVCQTDICQAAGL